MKHFLRRFYGAPVGWYLPPVVALLWNQAVYNGSKWFADAKAHYDFTTAFDALTPFVPFTVLIYWLSFLYFPIVFLLIARREQTLAHRFFAADLLAKAACLPFFLFLPTTNLRPVVAGSGIWDTMTRILYHLDAPTNLFPSIHCLLAWLCYLGVRDIPNGSRGARAGALLMALAICASTLTTKQHVIVDAASGVALAELCYRLAGKEAIRGVYTRAMARLTGPAAIGSRLSRSEG